MTDRVLVRLAADGSISRSDARPGRIGSPSSAHVSPVWVLVPGEEVLLTRTTLSARNRAQLLMALPFAVEDQLLDPVEELHFSPGVARDGEVGVAVVAKAAMHRWLRQLEEAGIRPDVVLPESLAVPFKETGAVALLDGDRCIVRLGRDSAFVCGLEELPGCLAAASIDQPIDVHDARSREAPPLDLPGNVAVTREADALAFLARGLESPPPINLLDGEFAPRHKHARGERLWRVAAILLVAALLLAMLGRAADTWRLSRDATRIEMATAESARKALPDLDAVAFARSDPEQLVRGRMQGVAAGSQTNGLLGLLGAIAPVLGGTTRVRTLGMEYRNGTLELGLRAPDVATLDAIRERFAAEAGLDVEVTAANAGESGIDGRIRISGAKP